MTIASPPVLDAVRADHLTKAYGSGEARVLALDDVSVSFAAGRFTAIVGPSGSGKSTLLHCCAGLDEPTSGHVWVGQTDITVLNDKALTHLRRDRMGFIFQAFNLLPMLTALDNIALPLKLSGSRPDPAKVEQIARVLGIQDRLAHRPAELSGGQQQRVAIARALISEPEVIFADEPTGALDSTASQDLLTLLRRCVDELGQSVIMVTHDAGAAAHADRALLLADGRIAGDLERPNAEALLHALRGLGS